MIGDLAPQAKATMLNRMADTEPDLQDLLGIGYALDLENTVWANI